MGMRCHSCETLIKDGLTEVKGVQKVTASSGKGMVMVEYDNSQTDHFVIKEAIRKEGFGVE